MWGAIDPKSSDSNQKDGTQLLTEYGRLGLNLVAADDAVEAGILSAPLQRTAQGLQDPERLAFGVPPP